MKKVKLISIVSAAAAAILLAGCAGPEYNYPASKHTHLIQKDASYHKVSMDQYSNVKIEKIDYYTTLKNQTGNYAYSSYDNYQIQNGKIIPQKYQQKHFYDKFTKQCIKYENGQTVCNYYSVQNPNLNFANYQ
ncbi:MAG: hypothetical protein R3Y52_01275 [Psittacicella sp.]